MPTDLQVLKARMARHGLTNMGSEHANNIIKKIIDAIFDSGGGCSSCDPGCSPGCQSSCAPGCTQGSQNGGG